MNEISIRLQEKAGLCFDDSLENGLNDSQEAGGFCSPEVTQDFECVRRI